MDPVNPNGALPLRDIHTLPAPDVWPLAPGWWVLGLGGLILLMGLSRWFAGRLQGWRRRRRIMKTLVALRAEHSCGGNPTQFAAQTSILLRRVALQRFSRDAVAGLSGDRWLAFLDATGGNGEFTRGAGRILTTAPYMADADFDIDGLYGLAQRWINHNM